MIHNFKWSKIWVNLCIIKEVEPNFILFKDTLSIFIILEINDREDSRWKFLFNYEIW